MDQKGHTTHRPCEYVNTNNGTTIVNRVVQIASGVPGRTILVLLAVLLLLCPEGATVTEYDLFLDDEPAAWSSSTKSVHPFVSQATRWRPTALNPVVMRKDILTEGDIIYVDLFDDTVYRAVVDRVTQNVMGTVTVRARLDDYSLGYVLISTTDDRSFASIRIPEHRERYLIQNLYDGENHFLLDLNGESAERLEATHPLVPPPSTSNGPVTRQIEPSLQGTSLGPLDHATVDVMIVYTPASREWAETHGPGIANVIAQSMEKAQLTLDNSGVFMSLRLVHAAEVSYEESGDAYTDLRRLTSPSDGYMDEVHVWRDMHGADLVSLFLAESNYAGLSWELNSPNGRPDYGFNLTRVQFAGTRYTHIHEMGHNMGLCHHKGQTENPGPGLFDYSAGWRWVGTNGQQYSSIMTYQSGRYFLDGQWHEQVAYISNPAIYHEGVPTGHNADGDNARTLREIKHVIAAYRTPPLEISTIEEFQLIGNDPNYPLDGSYFLSQDIDASASANWNGGMGFIPIGSWEASNPNAAFTGIFDGRGYVIRGLLINRPDEYAVGLFGVIRNGGQIRNLALEDGSVTGGVTVGGLVGYNYAGTISQCYATNLVSGTNYVGGLVGANQAGGAVYESFAASLVTGKAYIGGLAGANDFLGTISRSYAISVVVGDQNVGGLVGWNEGAVGSSFWDVEYSGINESAGGAGLTTSQMQSEITFIDAGWDFESVWSIAPDGSYPYLTKAVEWEPPLVPESEGQEPAPGAPNQVDYIETMPSSPGSAMGCGGSELAKKMTIIPAESELLHEAALPAMRGVDGIRAAALDSTLAVRLRAPKAIDTASILGEVVAGNYYSANVQWISATECLEDIWVLFAPVAPWTADEVVTFTAWAETISGAPVGPETFTFIVTEEVSVEEVTLTPAHTHTDGVGLAWQIGPDALFEEPVTVQIPVPKGWDLSELEVGYHFVSDADSQLVSAERVDGWLMPDSVHTVSDDDGDWIELTVRHGGVVQLKQRAAKNTPAGLGTSIPSGDLLVLLAMAGIIGLATAYRRRMLRS